MIVVPSAKGGPVLCLRADKQGELTEDSFGFPLENRTGHPRRRLAGDS